MKKSALLCFVWLAACSSSAIEQGQANNSLTLAYNTKVNAEPISQSERIRLLDLEAYRHRTAFEPLEKKRIALQAEHDRQFAIIEKEFPACHHQNYCDSDLFHGSFEKVTRYNELVSILRRSDFALFEVEKQIKEENYRHDLVSRNIYNRYLVHEILEIPQKYPFFNRFMVQSFEVFAHKKEFTNRILQFAGKVQPKIRSDLIFSTFGQEIDDGSVLLTLDIIPFFPGHDITPPHYLLTVLINTHQLDPQLYEKNFLKDWASSLWTADRSELKKEAYCGFYAIAADSIMNQFSIAQKNACSDLRDLLHGNSRVPFAEHMSTHEWLLPLAYLELESN